MVRMAEEISILDFVENFNSLGGKGFFSFETFSLFLGPNCALSQVFGLSFATVKILVLFYQLNGHNQRRTKTTQKNKENERGAKFQRQNIYFKKSTREVVVAGLRFHFPELGEQKMDSLRTFFLLGKANALDKATQYTGCIQKDSLRTNESLINCFLQ